MTDERNQNQITRKDAKNRFVESLNDVFAIGKVHLNFAAYDPNKPAGQRQTAGVHIFIAADEFMELCRKVSCGEFKYLWQTKKKNNDKEPLYQSLGGTSAEKLAKQNRSRPDGMSLSRTFKVMPGDRVELLLVADSGPGVTTEKGLITPKFGSKPENHIAVSLTLDAFGELLLATQAHYQAWLTAWYMGGCKTVQPKTYQKPQTQNNGNAVQPSSTTSTQSSFIPDAYLGISTAASEDDDDLPF